MHKFLNYLQKCSKNESTIEPYRITQPKVDPNDPHLYVEEQKQESKASLSNENKKRPVEV